MDSTSSDPHETLRPQLSKTAQNNFIQPSVQEPPHFEAPSAQLKYQGLDSGLLRIPNTILRKDAPPLQPPRAPELLRISRNPD